jgi:hypothetical protein
MKVSAQKSLVPNKIKNRSRKSLKILACILLGLALASCLCDSLAQMRVIKQATALSLTDADLRAAKIPPGTHIRNEIVPTFGIDGNWWVMHAERMIRERELRVRRTELDNAPEGREVHWSSGLIWLLAASSFVFRFFGTASLQESVTQAALYSGPVLFLIFSAVWFFVVRRIFGLITAACSVLLFASIPAVFSLFRFGNCDHHGLVAVFLSAGVFLFSCGMLRFEGLLPLAPASNCLLKWSGFLLAAGLWVSAATALPVIAALGAGLVIRFLLPQNKSCMVLPEGALRSWALTGGLSSIALYLLEYFPNHMGWRLEVNHPLYAIAWLAGGEILERMRRKASGANFMQPTVADGFILGVTLLVAVLPGVMIALAPNRFFWVSDRFLLHLHQWHINEFQPFFDVLDTENPLSAIFHCFIWPVFVIAAIPIGWKFQVIEKKTILALIPAFCVTTSGFALAMYQIRWIGPDLAQWAALVTVLCGLFALKWTCIVGKVRWLVLLPALVLLINPFLNIIRWAHGESGLTRLPKEMAPNIILRDVVQRILMMDASKKPRILCAPTSSTQVAFYSGAEVLGTLYWENKDGLKAAAKIFASTTEEETKQLLIQKGITHILIFSWDEFIVEYAKLLSDTSGKPSKDNALFIKKLISEETPPRWLRPLHYPIPESFEMQDQKVYLYQIVPDQSPAEYHMNLGLYYYDAKNYDKAIEAFRKSGLENPSDPRIPRLIDFCEKEKSNTQPTK